MGNFCSSEDNLVHERLEEEQLQRIPEENAEIERQKKEEFINNELESQMVLIVFLI